MKKYRVRFFLPSTNGISTTTYVSKEVPKILGSFLYFHDINDNYIMISGNIVVESFDDNEKEEKPKNGK